MPTGSVIFDNRCPAPRQKDATMNPKPVFYFCNLTGVINYGPLPSVGAQLIDCMDDAGIRCCRLTVEAMTELLRRRPDPAKAQAEIARQTQNAVAWEQAAIKARTYYAQAQTDLERERANNAAGLDMVRSECANLRAQLDRADQSSAARKDAVLKAQAAVIDAAHTELDAINVSPGPLSSRILHLRQMLRDPLYLTTLTDKARKIADMKAKVAEMTEKLKRLENE